MVILGGLELVAAGYLLHQHQKIKKERSLLEEESYSLQEDRHNRRRHSHERRHSNERRHSHDRRHSRDRRHGRSHSYDGEDKHRRSRSESRERRRRKEKEEYLPRPGKGKGNSVPQLQPLAVPVNVPGRQNNAPPSQRPAPVQRPPPTQQPPPGYPPTGWPAHWAQSQNPEPRASNPAGVPTGSAPPQAQAPPSGSYGYPTDVKYGFDPSIPHDQYPQPPPAYEPQASSSQQNLAPPQPRAGESREERRQRRRARSDSRRSVSPNMEAYDEDQERSSPNPRVRFAVDQRTLPAGERDSIRSPPPEYRA